MRVYLICLALAGCAAQSTGVVPIGTGGYMISMRGGTMDHSGGALKADLYRQASAFCAQAGKAMTPVASTARDAEIQYATAEVQFRCD